MKQRRVLRSNEQESSRALISDFNSLAGTSSHALEIAEISGKAQEVRDARLPKRKVQWADEADTGPEALLNTTTSASEPASYVDDKGMVGRLVDNDIPDDTDDLARSKAETRPETRQYLAAEMYNPIEYGDFRSYMKHKRAKLKIQEASLLDEENALLQAEPSSKADSGAETRGLGGQKSDALKGCCVYINGQTHPPFSELRRLLVLHGGDLMAYMDQKTPVTHIVASNLTPKKRIEFKDYKVVLPGWILESIELGKRADWRKWRCDASTGSNGHTSESMVRNPYAEATKSELGTGQWRNLNNVARMPKPLPRYGEEDESPWGMPSNQTNLLQRFSAAKAIPQSSSAKSLPQTTVVDADSDTPRHLPPQDSTTPTVDGRPLQCRELKQVVPSPLVPRAVRFSEADVVQDRCSDESASTSRGRLCNTMIADSNPDLAAVASTSLANVPTAATVSEVQTPRRIVAESNQIYYASRPSNTHAARLLSSPSWRERNTATSEGFLAGYFAKSRLHHLSTWKTSLQDMVSSALREAGRPLCSSDLPKGVKRVIFHIDFDSFFVAVGLKSRPDLVGKPVVVCHGTGIGMPAAKPGDELQPADNQSSSTSEIASCSYKAREFGVRNGMSLGQARRLCPEVQTIPYNFEAYNSISLTFYAFLLEHSDALQAVSVDEALVDVSLLLNSMRDEEGSLGSIYEKYRNQPDSQDQGWTEEKQLAESFRDEIRELCGCEASIGIGSNILLARLATRRAKPGGSFHLLDQAKQPFINDLNVDDLHGIGWSLRNRLREMFGTIVVGEVLARTQEYKLIAEFGPKKGKMIWDKMHGVDVDRIEGNKLRQSVGSHVNYGIRFVTEQEAEAFVDNMCHEVSQRTKAVKLRGRLVSVQVMIRAKEAPIEAPKFLGHGVCDTHHRSAPVSGPGRAAVDDAASIKAVAWALIRDLKADPKELRGIAISLNKLEPAEGNVVSPTKPMAGQAVLTFGSNSATAKAEARRRYAAKASALESDDLEDAQLDEGTTPLAYLEKGPDAATPRKPFADAQRAKTPPGAARDLQLPSPTQLMLPSRSQIDEEVISALPTQYRKQIEVKLGSAAPYAEHGSGAPVSSVGGSQQQGSQSRPRVLPRSTPTTPQKAKRTPTPAQAEALMLPNASQIDPSVLLELPESIRKEIERQTRTNQEFQAGSASSSTSSTPTKARTRGEGAALSMFLRNDAKFGARRSGNTRSVSESPSKKRMITKLMHGVAGSSRAGSYIAPDQPLVERDAALALDPGRIDEEALERLGIDAEVFRALPIDLQRETYSYHAEQRKSEKARFKAGKTNSFEELPIAETRRRSTLRAAQNELLVSKQLGRPAHSDESRKQRAGVTAGETTEEEAKATPPSFLIARPRRRVPRPSSAIFNAVPQYTGEIPSIRGLVTLTDVKKLVDQWVSAFASQGPRKGDVDRIASYLVRLIRCSASHVEDLEKVSAIIGWIRLKIEAAKPDVAERNWEHALLSIVNEVQSSARDCFAGADVMLP